MSEPRDLSLEAVNELLDSLHVNQQDLLFSKEDVLDFPTISEHPILQKVCADLSELMKCERVEIWMFNEDKTMLKLEVSYERGNDGGPYLSNKILHKDQVPAYFEAIKDKRTLAINNAENNPIMDGIKSSLSEEYHKINAMLDASIILNSGIGGVVCCLSETEREWTAVDKHVVASVADTLAFVFDRINQKGR